MAQTTHPSRKLLRLDEAEPRTGGSLLFEGREWTVTEQATYKNDEGYHVEEWCCETDDTTAYLLKESDPDQGSVRWFFTRKIEAGGLTLPTGQGLGEHLGTRTAADPPPSLTYRGVTYQYTDTTQGTHEDDSGTKVTKITWDYWDGAHTRNLAVERWPDGSFDCYLGAYIEPGQVTIRRADAPAADGRGQPNPFAVALAFLPMAYAVAFFMGWPFDEALALALPAAAASGWVALLFRVPLVAVEALAMAVIGAGVYWQFPPLTSAGGLAVVLATPVVIGWLAQRHGHAGKKRAVRYAAAFATGLPLLGVGFYAYFSWAPWPHTPEQLALALGPAVIAGPAGLLIASLLTRSREDGGA